jgi:hypothetical protein
METGIVREGLGVETRSRVQFRAIFCGLATTVGVLIVCVGISWAIGLSTFHPTANRATGLALGLFIWSAVALWISIFAGSYVAALVGRAAEGRDGVLNGLAVWGSVTALLGMVFLSVFAGVMNALLSLTGASNVAARAGVTQAPPIGLQTQLVLAQMAHDAGLILWIYWGGIAGGLLTAIAGGWLAASIEQRRPEPRRREARAEPRAPSLATTAPQMP